MNDNPNICFNTLWREVEKRYIKSFYVLESKKSMLHNILQFICILVFILLCIVHHLRCQESYIRSRNLIALCMYENFVAFSAIPWNVWQKIKKKNKPVFGGVVCQAYTMSPLRPALNMSLCLLSITHIHMFFRLSDCLNQFFISFFLLLMWLCTLSLTQY